MLGLDDGTRHSALCNPLLADLEAGTAPDECGAKADIVHLVLDVLGETYQVDINKNDLLSAIKCSSVPTDATNVLERWFNSWCGSLESLSARNKQDTQYFHMAFLIFFVVNGLCYPIRKPGLSCNFDSISSGLSMVVLVGALIRHIDSSRRYHSYEDILGEQAKFLTISTNVSKFNSYYFYSTYWWIATFNLGYFGFGMISPSNCKKDDWCMTNPDLKKRITAIIMWACWDYALYIGNYGLVNFKDLVRTMFTDNALLLFVVTFAVAYHAKFTPENIFNSAKSGIAAGGAAATMSILFLLHKLIQKNLGKGKGAIYADCLNRFMCIFLFSIRYYYMTISGLLSGSNDLDVLIDAFGETTAYTLFGGVMLYIGVALMDSYEPEVNAKELTNYLIFVLAFIQIIMTGVQYGCDPVAKNIGNKLRGSIAHDNKATLFIWSMIFCSIATFMLRCITPSLLKDHCPEIDKGQDADSSSGVPSEDSMLGATSIARSSPQIGCRRFFAPTTKSWEVTSNWCLFIVIGMTIASIATYTAEKDEDTKFQSVAYLHSVCVIFSVIPIINAGFFLLNQNQEKMRAKEELLLQLKTEINQVSSDGVDAPRAFS